MVQARPDSDHWAPLRLMHSLQSRLLLPSWDRQSTIYTKPPVGAQPLGSRYKTLALLLAPDIPVGTVPFDGHEQ